jgi:hypothetical protein
MLSLTYRWETVRCFLLVSEGCASVSPRTYTCLTLIYLIFIYFLFMRWPPGPVEARAPNSLSLSPPICLLIKHLCSIPQRWARSGCIRRYLFLALKVDLSCFANQSSVGLGSNLSDCCHISSSFIVLDGEEADST